MFGIGMGELLVIALVAVVIMGPQKIPIFMRTLARLYRQLLDLREEVQAKLLSTDLENTNKSDQEKKNI